MTMSIYCGRPFPDADLNQIHKIIDAEDRPNRAEISRRVCRQLQWLRPDGRLKDMSCRVALLRMHREGVICLPAPEKGNANGHRGKQVTNRTDPGFPVTDNAGRLPDLKLELVSGKQPSSLWNDSPPLPLSGLPATAGSPTTLSDHLGWPDARSARLRSGRMENRTPRPMDRLDRRTAQAQSAPRRQQRPIPDPAVGQIAQFGKQGLVHGHATTSHGLANRLLLPPSPA